MWIPVIRYDQLLVIRNLYSCTNSWQVSWLTDHHTKPSSQYTQWLCLTRGFCTPGLQWRDRTGLTPVSLLTVILNDRKRIKEMRLRSCLRQYISNGTTYYFDCSYHIILGNKSKDYLVPFKIGESGLYTINVRITENNPFKMVNGILKHTRHWKMFFTDGTINWYAARIKFLSIKLLYTG